MLYHFIYAASATKLILILESLQKCCAATTTTTKFVDSTKCLVIVYKTFKQCLPLFFQDTL